MPWDRLLCSPTQSTLLTHVSVIPKEGKDIRLRQLLTNLSAPCVSEAFYQASCLQSSIPTTPVGVPGPGGIHSLSQSEPIPLKVLNLVHFANQTGSPCVFLSTDAEKAIARVNWTFMFAVLRIMGFGHQIL